jgi:hypothetical protein
VVNEPEHNEAAPLTVPAFGSAVMVMLADELELPQVLLTVYVMVAEPAAIPVTVPVTGSTVAAALLLLLQLPPPVPLLANIAVEFVHKIDVPVTVPAFG